MIDKPLILIKHRLIGRQPLAASGRPGTPSEFMNELTIQLIPLLGGWEIIGFYWFFGFFGGFLVVFGQKTMVINHGY